MARPCKSRQLEGIPSPVLYMPSGWTRAQEAPAELAIEDFEVLRFVDGHALTIEEAAGKLGVSRSTAGRMLERARRCLALAIERRSPIYIDAADSSVLAPPAPEASLDVSGHAPLAIAVQALQLGSEVARIFGRAPAFALVSADGTVRFVKNPGVGVSRGAAALAVELLKSHGVERIAAGRFGPDALEQLGQAQVQPFLVSGMKLQGAVELLNVVKQ